MSTVRRPPSPRSRAPRLRAAAPRAAPAAPSSIEVAALIAPAAAAARAGSGAPAIGIPAATAAGAPLRDGPSVLRAVASVATLERDPRLAGQLTPPRGDAPPPGVAPRADRAGTRLLTINIHMGVPAGVALEAGNESVAALRDVARYVHAVDPDVVIMQEVRDRPQREGQAGLPRAASILFHLLDASDVAFTPALHADVGADDERRYGTAVFTRNGFTIDAAANAALPNSGPEVEQRSVGVAAVRPPDARRRLTVCSTHLAHREVEDQPLRDAQLAAIAGLIARLQSGGALTYRDALTGAPQRARGFPGKRVALGGDLNQQQARCDRVLVERGLTHVNALLRDRGAIARADAADRASTSEAYHGPPHRIDHWYGAGLDVVDVAVAGVPPVEHAGRAWTSDGVVYGPTDHAGVVVELA